MRSPRTVAKTDYAPAAIRDRCVSEGCAVSQLSQMDEGNPSSGEVLDFMRLVWAVDSGLHAVSGEKDTFFGANGQARLVLRVLSKYPPVCAGELAEIVKMSRAALSSVLKTLEKSGFVKREADPDDRRRTRVSLTKRGASASEEYANTVEAAVRNVFAKVTDRTMDSAKLVLNALACELEPQALRSRSKG